MQNFEIFYFEMNMDMITKFSARNAAAEMLKKMKKASYDF